MMKADVVHIVEFRMTFFCTCSRTSLLELRKKVRIDHKYAHVLRNLIRASHVLNCVMGSKKFVLLQCCLDSFSFILYPGSAFENPSHQRLEPYRQTHSPGNICGRIRSFEKKPAVLLIFTTLTKFSTGTEL